MTTHFELPVRSVPRIVEVLKENAMPVRIPEAAIALGNSFNCWSFTAYYNGWVDQAHWMAESDMEKLLATQTKSVPPCDVRAGDIAVFRDCFGGLLHTAVMMDCKTVCHKPGATPLIIESIGAAKRCYGDIIYFVRAAVDNV